ncbi:MAG: ZIP family metal transporter [Nanoarchaeota archaeon]|nr:ZIP family metal transporter [Nanoarchaeota archaeon]
MNMIWIYAILSVLAVSIISLIGVLSFSIKQERLKSILVYLISFSAGALFGDAFIHLFPELIKENGFSVFSGLMIISGILIFFFLEKVICWQHCHLPITSSHVHTFAYMNIVGDSLHNFIDGLVIGASYLINLHTGIATTIAVALHEIPQEIGDFGVMLHGGFSKSKALLINFLTALTSVIGAIVALTLISYIKNLQNIILPIAIGGFIYIAGSDLIPELHKETNWKKSMLQILIFIIGVAIMLALLLLE